MDWPELIAASFSHELGFSLCEPDELLDLPAVVLCHNTAPDPTFVFANVAAQRLWGRTESEFLGMPSRLTAAPQARAERAEALDTNGVVTGYSGVRVRQDGSLFRFFGATVWPVFALCEGQRRGIRLGQAATFNQWGDI